MVNRRLSRRGFLSLGTFGAIGAGSYLYGKEGIGAARCAFEARDAWRLAALPNEAFLERTRFVFARARLGCSFAPEEWNDAQNAAGDGLRALDFCVRELGLREVRIGIRWDWVERPDGRLDLGLYRPFLDYCFDQGVPLCLNVGPLRTFRWPEDRAPGFILERLKRVPRRGETIDHDSPLTDHAVSYLGRLLDLLVREYGDHARRLSAVQPENESFQGFDERSWRVTQAYMVRVIEVIDAFLPGAPVLVTTAGRPALDEITRLFEHLLRKSERYQGRLISGFDYYYSTPNHNKLPFDRYLDPIALAFDFPSARTCAQNIADARRVGFRIEVSEGQAEPYAHVTAPGNSVRDLRFMLLRCADKVLDPLQVEPLRIWGVEYWAKKQHAGWATAEHAAMFDLVRRLAFGG